jgi:hypothetical protein
VETICGGTSIANYTLPGVGISMDRSTIWKFTGGTAGTGSQPAQVTTRVYSRLLYTITPYEIADGCNGTINVW